MTAGRARADAAGLRLGLVLGAGGRAGVEFHRGVVRAVDELGLDARGADVIVGTSAGSLVAASLRRDASAGPPRDHRQRARAVLPGRSAVLELARRPREGLNALLLRPELRFGRLDMADVVDNVRRAHGTSWPTAPLWVVAVRRADGRRVVFGRPGTPPTDVASAVAASCAIPGYVSPVEVEGVAYVDGGVHSPTNADLLADCDLDLVVVSSPMSVDPRAAGPRLDLPARLRFHRFLRAEVWALRRPGLRIVTVEPDRATLRGMGLTMMRSRGSAEVQEPAYTHARRLLRAAVPTG
jgi:NTE family protein